MNWNMITSEFATETETPVGINWDGAGVRPPVLYGDVYISVQGGEQLYSSPRRDMPRLSDFTEVEVALWWASGWRAWTRAWTRPSEIGLSISDEELNYGDDNVAANVPISVARRLEEALRLRAEALAAK